MVMHLRRALAPLHITSKLFCIHPFSRVPLKSSLAGSFLSILGGIGYTIFHMMSAQTDQNRLDPDEQEENPNLVTIIIDSYNRYSGYCCSAILILSSIAFQGKIVKVIQILEEVDSLFEQKYAILVDNSTWFRNVSLQIFLMFALISTLEYLNCLMYIQDSIPLSEYCIIMCLVPLYVAGMAQIQFIAYLQLVRNRLKLLNSVLTHFKEIVKIQNTTTDSSKYEAVDKALKQRVFLDDIKLHNNCILDPVPIYSTGGDTHSSSKIGDVVSKTQLRDKSTTKISFANLVRLLTNKQRITAINDENEFRMTDFTEKVIQIQQIYTKLERVAIVLNAAYGIPIITILIIQFTTLTTLLYFCCMIVISITSGIDLDEDNQDQLVSSSGWIAMLLFEIFIVCYACSLLKAESKQIGCNLHHFAMNCDNTHCKIKIKAFSMQLLHDRIEFRPLGLFQLELSFMYGLIGAVCTYLIILIQFDLAQKQVHLGLVAN